ncbi:uncharacterized protein [Dermacentor andersoni]|uniref:uncharacterized protein isoform X2 n=1 Tax=Dermacentor andersoni TaxID=34620 RepID=UPI003B3AD806
MEEGRKYRRTCCVPQCANRTLRRKICLPSFPSDAAMRRGWMLRLCVDDFKCPQASTAERKLLRLKKTAVPSQCLPVTKDAEHAQLALTNICDMSTVLHESDGTHGRHEKAEFQARWRHLIFFSMASTSRVRGSELERWDHCHRWLRSPPSPRVVVPQ